MNPNQILLITLLETLVALIGHKNKSDIVYDRNSFLESLLFPSFFYLFLPVACCVLSERGLLNSMSNEIATKPYHISYIPPFLFLACIWAYIHTHLSPMCQNVQLQQEQREKK